MQAWCRAFNYSENDAPGLGSTLVQPFQVAEDLVTGVGSLVTGSVALVPGSSLIGMGSSKGSKKKRLRSWFGKKSKAM